MKVLFLLFLAVFFQENIYAERFQRRFLPNRPRLFSPFRRGSNQTKSPGNYLPTVNEKGERIIAINGVAVPSNAVGIKFEDDRLSFVFKDGTESQAEVSRSSQAAPSSPGPTGREHDGDSRAQSQPSLRPQATGNESDSLRASARPAPSPAEQAQSRGDQSSSPSSEKLSSDLFPAGTNGNPGFPYKVIGPGFSEKCQATLISKEKNLCMAATASHCLMDGAKRALDKGIDNRSLESGQCERNIAQKGIFWGKGEIETADFGKVEATFFINPEYHSGTKSEDSAVFSFPCNEKSPVKPLPVNAAPLKDGETVYYGKVMGGKEGLYEGKVWREPGIVGINSRPVGEAQESVVQPEDVAIQQGDSGGGIYRKRSDGSFELVGVLSTSDDITKKRPIGNYATNRSLQFIECIKGAFRRG